MMTDNNLENKIQGLFRDLPRKSISIGNNQTVWLRVQNHILRVKLLKQAAETRSSVWNIFLLRSFWGKALAILLMVLVAISIVGGTASATPGETLYPVKKAAERVEKVLAGSKEARVKITIKHAKRRLTEVQILVAQDRKNGVVSETLDALTSTTQDAVAASESKPGLKGQIFELTSHEEKVLTRVQTQVEGEVKAAVEKALSLTKESLSKLISPDQVQGAAAAADDSQNSLPQQATSTVSETVNKTQSKPVAPAEGFIQSEIQIHDVITVPSN